MTLVMFLSKKILKYADHAWSATFIKREQIMLVFSNYA